MPSPVLVDAGDLRVWADRRDAQERMPQLIRRLILTTTSGISRIDFASGDDVLLGGWDGIAQVAIGNAHVPAGLSGWEIGVNRDVKGKADSDYQKRTADPLGITPSTATFIFVTPRRWAGKDAWAAAKTKSGPWKEVRAYDAGNLETWLETSPSVHLWLTDLLGKGGGAADDLGTHWTNWTQETQPSLSPPLVVGGRAEQANAIRARLTGDPCVVPVRADSQEEAIMFVAAAIHELTDVQRDAMLSRCVVIADVSAWRWATTQTRPLILIPTFGDVDVMRATRSGHHVVLPLGREVAVETETVDLGRMRYSASRDALVQMGVGEDRADVLAAVARDGLLSLRRKLAIIPALRQPRWASPSEGSVLLPALLAGAWNGDVEADRLSLSTLSGRDYAELERDLARWANESDPPTRQKSSQWSFTSMEDGYVLLGRLLSADHLKRLAEVAIQVLGEDDPAFDLPANEQWMASIQGKSRRYSTTLRTGLATTLAALASRLGDTPLAGGLSGQDRASLIVRDILARAQKDTTGRAWASLSDVLPLLAEAAPDEFLNEVEHGLVGDEPVLRSIFADANDAGSVFARSPHTGLLWALEGLAWSRDHMPRAALQLARLARLDPGGTQGNRPRRSLREVFLLWHPQTSATLDERLAAIDMLRRREPAATWQLMIDLLPSFQDVSSPTRDPEWRAWKSETMPPVSNAEWNRAVEEIGIRILADAPKSDERWCQVIASYDALPVAVQDGFVDALGALDLAQVAATFRRAIWDAIREVVEKHRRFRDAKWALPKERVDKLAGIHDRFEPANPVEKYRWLFGGHPDLPDADKKDWRTYRAALSRARSEAIGAIFKVSGLEGLLQITQTAAYPGEVGAEAAKHPGMAELEPAVMTLLDSPDPAKREFSAGFSSSRFDVAGWDWVDRQLTSLQTSSPDRLVALLASLPACPRTWDTAAVLGAEIEAAYWKQAKSWAVSKSDVRRAVEALVRFGRAHVAIDLLGAAVDDEDSGVDPALVASALESGANQVPDRAGLSMLWHHVAELLDYLGRSEGVDDSTVARLEWAYLPLLHGRSPKVLEETLSKDPAFFAELVSWVYRAEDDEASDSSPESATRARLGHELLRRWRRVPGRRDDGSLDGDALESWVGVARALCAEARRAAIGDQQIGHVLRHAPVGSDAAWPHESVRELIDDLASDDLELGIEVEVVNSRGVTSRSPTSGGQQERDLAQWYLTHSEASRIRWPRTAAMLRRIAESFNADARRHDAEAELIEDTFR